MSDHRDWRVGHQGRDRMHYEERVDGVWERIDISREMLTGRAHHVINFASPSQWQRYPAWARDHREEIIARIRSEFAAPDCEYHEPQASAAAPPDHRALPRPPAATAVATTRRDGSSRWGMWVTILVLLLIVIGMGIQVQHSTTRGATTLPVSRGGSGRTVLRAEKPTLFWVSVGLYGTVGIGALGMAIWVLRASRSSRRDAMQETRGGRYAGETGA